MAKKKKNESYSPRIVNRRALRDYQIDEKIECGIVLLGSEVKSIRLGQVSLAEGYARVEAPRGKGRTELWLYDIDIAAYSHASPESHDPKRRRKLLAHRRQIESLLGSTTAKGTTLVPMAMYFVNGRVKIEIGIGTGKKHYDKRESIKGRDADREMRRAMTRKII